MIGTLDTTDARAGLIQFSAAIYEPGDTIEVRGIKKGEDRPRVKWTTAADLPDLAEALASDNADGWNVYGGINPRPCKYQRGDEVIDLARAVFADFDDSTLADARAKWDTLGLPAPTLVIESGHGAHIYARLTYSCDDLAAWSALQWDLAIATGADVKIKNPERIMRLPGFTNWKREPVPCCIAEVDATRRADFDDLRAIVPPRHEPERPRVTLAALRSDPENIVYRCMKYLARCPDSIDGQDGSGKLYRAAMETMRFALMDGDAWQVLQWFNGAKCSPAWSDRELRHKLDDARKNCNGEFGSRLLEDRPQHTRRAAGTPQSVSPAQRDDPPIAPDIIGVAALVANNPDLRRPVIHNLLRLTEIGNIIAPPKRAKSWLALLIGSHVATGRAIFNTFTTERGRVLLIDNELHPNTLAKRVPAVAGAAGILSSELDGWLFVDSLRGRLRDLYAMGSYFLAIEPGRFDLIIMDALYRFMPRDHDENSNAQMTQLYNRLDHYAKMTGAAFLLVHHASKGLQSAKSITDVGAGAGAISRAADAHLILRDHEADGVAVLESVVRSWAPSPAICVRWEWPLWTRDGTLNPADLRQDGRRRQRTEDTEPTPEPKKTWTPEDFAGAFVTDTPKAKELILARATAEKLTERDAIRLLLRATDDGLIFQHEGASKNDRKAYFANRPPTVFDSAQTVSLSHTQPPTPPVCVETPRGEVSARRKRGKRKEEGGAK